MKPTDRKWTFRLKRNAIRAVDVTAKILGYSKDEASLRASSIVQRLFRPFQRKFKPDLDLCLVIPDKSKGWILEAVCREIGRYYDGSWEISGRLDCLPQAKAYFFCHYHFFLSALKKNPHLFESQNVVWLTHPKEQALGGTSTLFALRQARVVTMCSMWKELLVEMGFPTTQIATIVGAADSDFFPSHSRGSGKVGFCTAYYERKSPERMVDVIRAMPNTPFILMGRNWEDFPHFQQLKNLPNLEYRQAEYSEYPAFYQELDVFVSLSNLEGGPIPLIEAMMSNVVPVATYTGFAPDIIEHGQNGFLCDIGASTEEICGLISVALANRAPVRPTVEHLTWRRFSQLMQVELGLCPPIQRKLAS